MLLIIRCVLFVALLGSLGVLAGRNKFEERTPARAVADYLLPRYLTQGYVYVGDIQYPGRGLAVATLSDNNGNRVQVNMFLSENHKGFIVTAHIEQ